MIARMLAVYRLGLKELYSLSRDTALVLLIVYAFTYAVFGPAHGARTELRNASIAIVDEDRSMLSLRIRDALLAPEFIPVRELDHSAIDDALDQGKFTFVVDIPSRFQADLTAGRNPAVQVMVDATAMSQAGRGAGYIESIVLHEIERFAGSGERTTEPVRLVTRAKFNPNLNDVWFLAVSQIINNITMLAILLSGAALMREREHGTVEHLLVMPLTAGDIMLAKVWASALVIVVAATLSLELIVRGMLQVPIAGSVVLFMAGTALYMFAVSALGIFLATLARSMPQFGLLAFLVFLPLNMLSGGTTPLDSMPQWLQSMMQFSPTAHFVSSSMAILYRGAGLQSVWPQLCAVAGLGALFFLAAHMRFRRTITLAGG